MNLNSIKSIKQYNNFLEHINPFGKFQKKITLITLSFWLFAGIVRTIFDKEIFFNVSQELPFLNLSIILGLFASPYCAYYYNRKYIIIALSGIYTAGALILLVCPQDMAVKIAIYMISFSQYSSCICTSCILIEYVSVNLIPILAWAFLFMYHLGKFSSILIFYQINDKDEKKIILGSAMLGFGVLSIGGSLLFKESLRFLIDNDISKAEILALQISQENQCQDEKILNIIEGSFIWSKVNIKRYGLSCFKKYNSLGRQTYYLGLSFFCLGVFGKFALAIFQINERKKGVQFQHEVQLLWIGIFQLLGFLPGIICYKVFQRRKICLATSIFTTIFSLILLFLVKYIMIPHAFIAVFSLLGINSFIESILFFFMFLHSIEFYPHTIRTLGVSICLCCYFLGHLFFNLHFYFISDQHSSFQLVFCCSFTMIFHLFNITETFGKQIQYQIKQIQQRDFVED